MNIQPVTPAIGAEIEDLDLSAPLDSQTLRSINQAFLNHHVLFFREQKLNPADLVRIARHFGPVAKYPFAEPLPNQPEVVAIIKEPAQKTVFGGIWHTDSAYLETPSMASLLYALEVPALGGDTLFSNQHLAFETLSHQMQTRLRSLRAVHSSVKNQAELRADHLQGGAMKSGAKDVYTRSHPVVRRHPETQRESLYLSPAHTTEIEGMEKEKSDALLAQLFEHALKDDFKCRFRWRSGTLALWDNRCTLHYPINDYHGQRREMHRVSIDGDRPV
ncbi:MAG: TauD/TfdA family dioxygenase [Gammaproteobacteria bacterium]|nr:TauD/TfdA family dioxygenase [Gammaproteobacteria bacterium]